jgi:threonine dehydratase
MRSLDPVAIGDIYAARERIAGSVIRTPLVRLHVDAHAEIWLKLENLQPIGSFKLRGATNAIGLLSRDELARGVYTASAGNMAQGLAWGARERAVPCTVIVPDHAPRTKLDAIARLGARAVKVPFDEWWRVMLDHGRAGMEETFIHPVADAAVIAGNGTIGVEIAEDLPDVDTVLVPFGGGGLSCGIATAIRALAPRARIFACEVETAAPLAASIAANAPASVDRKPSFIDGIGGKSVHPEMWPLVRSLLDGSLVVSVDAAAAALRLILDRTRVLAEGAGAVPVAAALAGMAGGGKVVCVVSGGNIDIATLAELLRG